MITTSFCRRAVHLDFHTMPDVSDVGRDFQAEKFAKTLKAAHVDYVTVFARCNVGFAYYPTKIGTVHPGLKFDLLGEIVRACHGQGIKVTAYFNAALDHENALRHREWCRVNKDGNVYDYSEMGSFCRTMCFNTGYGSYLLSMIEEVFNRYPVDGIFLDCYLKPCYGNECLEGMKELHLDTVDDSNVLRFSEIVTERFVEKVRKLVEKKNRNIYLYFNGIPYSMQPDHIEIEVLPQAFWGYEFLPAIIRYVRTLGKPVITQTGRFNGDWGDFGGLRSEQSLLFDCYNSISNGGTCMVGDHLHPRGKLDSAVYDIIGKVYSKIEKLEPFVEGAEPLVEMAVIEPLLSHLHTSMIGRTDFSSLYGATRILRELKYQFDVTDGTMDLAKYRIVVLPDNIQIDDDLKQKLEGHLKNGGIIISSAWAGLNKEKTGFTMNEYGISCDGREPFNVSFFETGEEVNRDMPNMLTAIYKPGIAMRVKKNAKVLAKLIRPYFNYFDDKSCWDRCHLNYYVPPMADSGRPALVQSGSIFHFSFPIFTSYFEEALISYRTLVRNCIDRVFPSPVIRIDGFPSFGQVMVTLKGNKTAVHLLAYIPELRGGKRQIVEDCIKFTRVSLSLRTAGRKLSGVYLVPSMEKLEYREHDGYSTVIIPEVNGYQMIIFEFNGQFV